MIISISKISALTQFKVKELFKNKTFLVSVLMVPAFIILYRYGFSSMMKGDGREMLLSLILRMGTLFSTVMVSLMMPATLLAKDKEKNTLRTLMTSSVTGIDYFISCILPILLVTIVLNLFVLIVSGVSLATSALIQFFLATTLSAVAASILGMIVGIFSKNQMAASNNMVGLMMVLMMVPLFSDMIDIFEKINNFIFTGIVAKMVTGFATGNNQPLKMTDWLVMIVSCVIFMMLFLVVYRRNGFEKE